ncbi:MAG: hypothetical protein J6Y07_02075 [Alphaproteobacteria bacterium]|nr:hypothetical protein [Alphaproteobacteria bacterium]
MKKDSLIPTVTLTIVGKESSPRIITPKDIQDEYRRSRFDNGDFRMTYLEGLIRGGNLDAKDGFDLKFENLNSVDIDSCMGRTKFRTMSFVNVKQLIASTSIQGKWNIQTVEKVWFTDARFFYDNPDFYDADIQWNPKAKRIDLAGSVGLRGNLDFSQVGYVDLSDADLTNIDGIKTNPEGIVFCWGQYRGRVYVPNVHYYDPEPLINAIVYHQHKKYGV